MEGKAEPPALPASLPHRLTIGRYLPVQALRFLRIQQLL